MNKNPNQNETKKQPLETISEKAFEVWRISQGFPRCPKCNDVMDWDTEVDEQGNPTKGYFFCWNDDTIIPDTRR